MDKGLTSARRQILEILKRHNGMTADELSKIIGTSAVAIRQHLTTLEAEGLVSLHLERRPVGRPVHVFRLTEAADELFPKSYHQLTKDILEDIRQTEGDEAIKRIFENRRKKIAAEMKPAVTGKDLEGRVTAVAQLLNERGYMTDLQPSNGGFVLTVHNCVISKVAKEFPQACEEELALFADLLDANVTRTCHMHSGSGYCQYFIYLNGNRARQVAEAAD
jgi:predicted ArsR family transcriptional regulator